MCVAAIDVTFFSFLFFSPTRYTHPIAMGKKKHAAAAAAAAVPAAGTAPAASAPTHSADPRGNQVKDGGRGGAPAQPRVSPIACPIDPQSQQQPAQTEDDACNHADNGGEETRLAQRLGRVPAACECQSAAEIGEARYPPRIRTRIALTQVAECASISMCACTVPLACSLQ